MSKGWLSILSALAMFSAAAVPTTGYYYPSSMQTGTTVRVIIGGMGMHNVNGGYVTGEGVKVMRTVLVPYFPRATGKTQPAWVRSWMFDILEGKRVHRQLPPEATTADTDWPKCSWWSALDERDDLELQIVARDRFTPESYPQATPALDQLLILDIEVAPDAKPGMRQIVICDKHSASIPHPLLITTEPHVVEPFFVCPERNSKLGLPAALHLPNNFEPVSLPVVLDGQVWAGETDVFKLHVEKGTRLTCMLTGRELLPYMGDAVPGFFNPTMRLKSPKGEVLSFADDFFYLPDPILSCVVPETGDYVLEVEDNIFRGRSDYVYYIRCFADIANGPTATASERAFECSPPPVSHLPPTSGQLVVKGVIDCPGRNVRHDFTVSEPGQMDFELFARRSGSPLDGVLRLYGPLDKTTSIKVAPLIAEWDDEPRFLAGTIPQAMCDPHGVWEFRTPGNYAVVVSDRTDCGGDDYTYTLAVTRPEPTFEVYSTKSAFVFHGNGVVEIPIKVVRKNGFRGVIRLDSTDQYEFSGEIAADQTEGKIRCRSLESLRSGLTVINFTASGEVEPGRFRKVKVTACDPSEQAFAYTHLVPAGGFFFCKAYDGQ